MQMCATSPWVNKWQDVYDFTAHKTAESGVPNFSVNTALNWKMMAPLGEINEKVSKIKEFKSSVMGVQDIKDSDLDLIRLEFDEEQMIMPALFDVGPYFNAYAQNIIKGVVPSAQFKRTPMEYSNNVLLVAFVADFDALFDSTTAVLDHQTHGPADLRSTL